MAPELSKRGEPVVEVPPLQAMKLAIYQAMLEQQVTQVTLGEHMGLMVAKCAVSSGL